MRVRDIAAPAPRVRDDNDEIGAVAAQLSCLAVDGFGQWRKAQPDRVGGNGLRQPGRRQQADYAHPKRPDFKHDGWTYVVPGNRFAGCIVDQVGGDEGEMRLARAPLQCAARVVAGPHRDGCLADRTEVEFVIADGSGVDAERIVGLYHARAFGEIGRKRALPHVARVQYQNGAAVGNPKCSQRSHVRRYIYEAPVPASRFELTVNVIDSDYGNRNGIAPHGLGRACGQRKYGEKK